MPQCVFVHTKDTKKLMTDFDDNAWSCKIAFERGEKSTWYAFCILNLNVGSFLCVKWIFFFINHDLCCLANDARIYHQSYIEEFHSTVNFYSLLFHGTFPLNAILKNFSSLTHSLVVFTRSISLSLIFCACENGEKMLFSTAQLTNTWWWWWWWAHKTP